MNGRPPRREDYPPTGVNPSSSESIPSTQTSAVSMYSSQALNGHHPSSIRLQNDADLPNKKRKIEKEVSLDGSFLKFFFPIISDVSAICEQPFHGVFIQLYQIVPFR